MIKSKFIIYIKHSDEIIIKTNFKNKYVINSFLSFLFKGLFFKKII